MRLPALALSLFALAGCADVVQTHVGGRLVQAENPELRQSLKGERVVDMTLMQPTPIFDSWSPEIEERLSIAGEQIAREKCGGPAELVSLVRQTWIKRTADARFRCL